MSTVLVIDDDEQMRALVQHILEDAGYTVQAVASGTEGVAAAARRRPQLVISDVHMPGKSGYEVCRRVRELWNDVPFIFLSGTRTKPHDRVAGFEFGADDYVTKPFDPEELVARVRALLRRASPPGDPTDDTSNTTLTAREQEILRYLAEGISQAEVADRLVLSPKTVGKHIERILKKLGVRSRAEAVAAAYRRGIVDP